MGKEQLLTRYLKYSFKYVLQTENILISDPPNNHRAAGTKQMRKNVVSNS